MDMKHNSLVPTNLINSTTKNLSNCSLREIQDFLDSFDTVLSDCDGVLWDVDTPIKGAIETLKDFANFGKNIHLVSNNSTLPVDYFCKKVAQAGLEITEEQIVIPPKVIAWYLKKNDFQGEAFVIASKACKTTLKNSGIEVMEDDPKIMANDRIGTLREVQDRPMVKAVIGDFDIDCNWAKLALAISCLSRDDVLYLAGATDTVFVCNNNKILGSGPLIDLIAAQSGKKPIECCKPSEVLKTYVFENCKVTDPRRCIFIGDTINHDMKFGTMCGFKKLFVGTGCDNIEDALSSKEHRPDYYISNLGCLHFLLNDPSRVTPR